MVPTSAVETVATKENILLKKEIGEYDDRICHLFCVLTFKNPERNQFYLHTSHPALTTDLYIHKELLYIYTTHTTGRIS